MDGSFSIDHQYSFSVCRLKSSHHPDLTIVFVQWTSSESISEYYIKSEWLARTKIWDSSQIPYSYWVVTLLFTWFLFFSHRIMFPKISVSMLLLAMCIVLAITNSGEAAYRKPPFNGSIFGKRSGNNIGN